MQGHEGGEAAAGGCSSSRSRLAGENGGSWVSEDGGTEYHIAGALVGAEGVGVGEEVVAGFS